MPPDDGAIEGVDVRRVARIARGPEHLSREDARHPERGPEAERDGDFDNGVDLERAAIGGFRRSVRARGGRSKERTEPARDGNNGSEQVKRHCADLLIG